MESKSMIPIGWTSVLLRELVVSVKGKKPKFTSTEQNCDFSIPYVNIKAFEQKVFDEYTDGDGCTFCDDDDILMVWDGSRSGYTGKSVAGALGSTLMKLRFSGIDNNYSYLFLISKYQEINTHAKGTGTPHVDPGVLWSFVLPIAPIIEQKRIVEKAEELFSELDKGIENLKTAQQQLDIFRKAIFQSAYQGDLTSDWRIESASGNIKEKTNTDDWQMTELGEITDLRGGITKGRNFKGEEVIKLPYLRVANVQNGYLDLREMKQIELLESEKERYLLKADDILYTEGGDKDKLGRGTIWRNEIDECVHQNHIFRARITGDSVIPKYLAFYSQSKTARDYFYRHAKQTVNLASINMTVLKHLPVPLPCKNEQLQIVQEIETRLSICDKMEETIAECLKKAEVLRQSILKKAFEGRLVPQDPNDEPADKLLERIRLAKESPSYESKSIGKGRGSMHE